MAAFLGKAGIVNDQRAHRTMLLDAGQHTRANCGEHGVVRPVGLRHEVMQRLVRRLHALRFYARCHRLHALALARQQQAGAIGLKWRRPIGVPKRPCQSLDIGRKA